jgi:hypothetical protein
MFELVLNPITILSRPRRPLHYIWHTLYFLMQQ